MTPEQFQALYAQRAAAIPAAVRRGTRNVLLAVEQKATANLSGSGAPGSYPIPVRTGNLRRSMGVRQESDTVGYVFNRAVYARAHHEGFHPYGNKKAKRIPARPFLTNAAEAVDTGMIFRRGFAKALGLPE